MIITTQVEATDLNRITFEPDGHQGGKLVLGFTGEDQFTAFQKAVDEKGKGGSIKILKEVAIELNIPVVDH